MRWNTYIASSLYQTQMPPDFTIELCVWDGLGAIFQVRLNFSADDRGTKGKGGRGWY